MECFEQRDEVESTATRLAQHIRDGQDAPIRLTEALADQPRHDPAEQLTAAMSKIEGVSEVVLIVSKSDVDY